MHLDTPMLNSTSARTSVRLFTLLRRRLIPTHNSYAYACAYVDAFSYAYAFNAYAYGYANAYF